MDDHETARKTKILGRMVAAVSALSSAWPVVASVGYLLSVCCGLLYWTVYYDALGVSYGAHFRLEDLGIGLFRKPTILLATFCIVGTAYVVSRFFTKSGLAGYSLIVTLFAMATTSVPVIVTNGANADAAQVVVLRTQYFDVKLSGKSDQSMERVVLAGGMSEFLVFYDPKTLRSKVVSRATVASITASEILAIDESQNGSSWLMYVGPNLYDEEKLKYRGYKICTHRDGGVLPRSEWRTYQSEKRIVIAHMHIVFPTKDRGPAIQIEPFEWIEASSANGEER